MFFAFQLTSVNNKPEVISSNCMNWHLYKMMTLCFGIWMFWNTFNCICWVTQPLKHFIYQYDFELLKCNILFCSLVNYDFFLNICCNDNNSVVVLINLYGTNKQSKKSYCLVSLFLFKRALICTGFSVISATESGTWMNDCWNWTSKSGPVLFLMSGDWLSRCKEVLHPRPILWLSVHFSQKLQHIGDK